MKITKRQLRRVIRESLLLEWAPEKEGDLPKGFKEPTDMKVTFDDVPDGPRNRRKVVATASKGGVSFEGDPVYYFTNESGTKMARIAYEKAVVSARIKHNEDK